HGGIYGGLGTASFLREFFPDVPRTRDAGFCWGMMVEGRGVMWEVVERSRKRGRGCRKRWRENRIYQYWSLESVFLLFSAFSTVTDF
nr:hypothetical protein [Tanacetum cinerariifolium]